jgi:hypothetical protein
VDTQASVLVYNKDQTLHIFTLPPGRRFTPAEVLDWVTRSQPTSWLSSEDLPDLTRAVGDLLGPSRVNPVPEARAGGGPKGTQV